ncbi:Fe2+-enterobactin ABC transporter substrate-binding protein [Rhodococcus sp. 14-2483-1-2]|uniref:Fe2+-enterobactin ABC transporter substrate-binding protein n=1 Tax=Rhodococcus sp. 14-2483-1-2 TaxID=2023147 RepID=UPI000B9AF938|nr:Fe2+-enterobactin ABC transporter substrate-binding protein [Rhodococcus sp. 14-2483-1-2]OZF26167.1 Fe2+-enterobactin ABC transporter substrate-binding protein [Rhodococcus sp. 14-2483-1-2]
MHNTTRTLARTTLLTLAATLALAGCSSTDDSSAVAGASSTASADSTWPRTVDTEQGPVQIPAQPERIVSTAVTLTGSLLAVGAPVVASGATSPNSEVADEQGFFTQWGEVADERGVEPLPSGDLDVENVIAYDPDLIVVSKTGADSAAELYDQLSQIAPTIVLDYGNKTWQDVTTIMGEATGHENNALATIDSFERTVADAKKTMTLPPQPTTALVYNGPDGANVWTAESAQGKLLTELGFSLAELPVTGNGPMSTRKDIVPVAPENFTRAFIGNTVILVNADDSDTATYIADPLLAQTPAVIGGDVYAVGVDTFRLDFYSATNFVERLTGQRQQ